MEKDYKEKLRVEWYALYGDDFPGGQRDKYFDYWLAKIGEVLEEKDRDWEENLRWAFSVCPRYQSYIELAEAIRANREKLK